MFVPSNSRELSSPMVLLCLCLFIGVVGGGYHVRYFSGCPQQFPQIKDNSKWDLKACHIVVILKSTLFP